MGPAVSDRLSLAACYLPHGVCRAYLEQPGPDFPGFGLLAASEQGE